MNAFVITPLSRAEHAVLLKLYSSVSCGFPSPATDYEDPPLSLDELVGIREPSMYLIRARGDSMIGVGIFDGDVLVVDRAIAAYEGCVLISSLTTGFLAKTLRYQANGRPSLYSENPEYPPILIGPDDTLEVFGVCTWNLHPLGKRR